MCQVCPTRAAVRSRPLGPEVCGGRRQRGLVAGRGHEQKEPGLLCAAGRARLSQPLQAAGRVSGGAHGGNQGNGLAPCSGSAAPPAPGCRRPPSRGPALEPCFPPPRPTPRRGWEGAAPAPRGLLRHGAPPGPKMKAGERPRRRRWGSSTWRLCPCRARGNSSYPLKIN